MKTHVKNYLASLWKKAGFYIVLGTCAATVIGTAIYTGNRPSEAIEMPTLPPAATVYYTPRATYASAVTTPQSAKEEPFTIMLPCEGEIIGAYDDQNAVYNKTLGHYTVHSALDIAATESTVVKACQEGTVSSVYEDALWGGTVEIEHENGYTSVYCSLGSIMLVKAGDPVTQGQSIAFAGTALSEQHLGTHVHFVILKNGVPCDPNDLLG